MVYSPLVPHMSLVGNYNTNIKSHFVGYCIKFKLPISTFRCTNVKKKAFWITPSTHYSSHTEYVFMKNYISVSLSVVEICRCAERIHLCDFRYILMWRSQLMIHQNVYSCLPKLFRKFVFYYQIVLPPISHQFIFASALSPGFLCLVIQMVAFSTSTPWQVFYWFTDLCIWKMYTDRISLSTAATETS